MNEENKSTIASGKLEIWQKRLARSNVQWNPEIEKMNKRELIYNGSRELKPLVPGDTKDDGTNRKTSHVRNIVFENIESRVSSTTPPPKVTPKRKKDEHLAQIIERFLRNEKDRLPFEIINDLAERTVPIQGGVGYLVEWDNSKRSHTTVGESMVSLIHPKQFGPQPGIYTGISDMDWFIIKYPTTKETIRRKYGKSVYRENEAEPEVRAPEGADSDEDAVTQYIGFERNENGGINRYSWVNDVELEDLKDYQARRLPTCTGCGRVRPLPGQLINSSIHTRSTVKEEEAALQIEAGRMLAERLARRLMDPEAQSNDPLGESFTADEPLKYDGGACPWCGCEEFEEQIQEYEEILIPITTTGGMHIPGVHPEFDDMGVPVMAPTKIPFYKPDMFPIVLQRSVSVYGQLLGNSDVDAIEDQQNTTNRIEQKIIDRLMKAGTRITLPDRMLNVSPEDGERWYLNDPSEKAMIGVHEFTGNLQYELLYLSQVYEEGRQILGITDSLQGRRDPTATSGKAKEYSAAMAAGRMESMRVMKNAAYAQLYELMFKCQLAYADEPRPISYKNHRGETVYEEFNRYDFLEQDEDGQWYWNDQFLFSCDTAEPLASNREAMWQETRMNLQTGAFGDRAKTETLILFWTKMEEQHYPGAGETKRYLEEKLQQEQIMAQQIQQAQQITAQGTVTPTAVMGGVSQAAVPSAQ